MKIQTIPPGRPEKAALASILAAAANQENRRATPDDVEMAAALQVAVTAHALFGEHSHAFQVAKAKVIALAIGEDKESTK